MSEISAIDDLLTKVNTYVDTVHAYNLTERKQKPKLISWMGLHFILFRQTRFNSKLFVVEIFLYYFSLSIPLSAPPSFSLCIYLTIYLPIYLSISLPLSFILSVTQSISISLSIPLSFCLLFFSPSLFFPSLSRSLYLSLCTCTSVYMK